MGTLADPRKTVAMKKEVRKRVPNSERKRATALGRVPHECSRKGEKDRRRRTWRDRAYGEKASPPLNTKSIQYRSKKSKLCDGPPVRKKKRKVNIGGKKRADFRVA